MKPNSITDHQAFKWAVWASIAVMGGGMLHRALAADWTGAVVIGFFFVLCTVLMKVKRLAAPPLFEFLFALAGLLVAPGYVWDLYDIGLFDEITHLYCSFATTTLVGYLLYSDRRLKMSGLPFFVLAFAILNVGMTIAVVWEFFEYFAGIIGDLEDTLSDLALDMLGSAFGALLAAKRIKSRG